MDVSGSSGGLLCLLQYPETFFLLNPTTRESITLRPDPDYPVKLYGFGYVSLADDYKVIKIAASSMVRVYSTKTNSWKRVQCDFPYNFDAYSGKKPACVDGVVHWLVSDPNTFLRTAIVGFDFNEEKFKEIPLPDKVKPNSKMDIFPGNLGVLRGLLCVSFEIYPERLELWLMLEYGVRESWNKIVIPYCLTRGKALKGLLPLGILKGQLLLQLDRRFLFLYDHVKVKFEHLKLSLPQGPCCKFGTTVYSEEEPCCAFGVIVYEKSLVSPCGYFWLDESRAARLEE